LVIWVSRADNFDKRADLRASCFWIRLRTAVARAQSNPFPPDFFPPDPAGELGGAVVGVVEGAVVGVVEGAFGVVEVVGGAVVAGVVVGVVERGPLDGAELDGAEVVLVDVVAAPATPTMPPIPSESARVAITPAAIRRATGTLPAGILDVMAIILSSPDRPAHVPSWWSSVGNR
jgi:hypothetical protein